MEPPPELSSAPAQPMGPSGDKKREMLDQTADLKLAERYLEAARKYNESLEVNKENSDSNSKQVSFVQSQGQLTPSSTLKPF